MIEQRIPPTLKNSACWEFESLHPCHIQEASVERLGLFYACYSGTLRYRTNGRAADSTDYQKQRVLGVRISPPLPYTRSLSRKTGAFLRLLFGYIEVEPMVE